MPLYQHPTSRVCSQAITRPVGDAARLRGDGDGGAVDATLLAVAGATASSGGLVDATLDDTGGCRSLLRWGLPLAITALTTACSTPRFAGEWAYAKTCDRGHFVSLHLEQSGASVTGDWSAGTLLRGNDGQLQGRVRGNRLYVRYCSDDGGVGYQACPAFGPEDDYFTIEKGMLLRHQRFGAGFAPDIALQAAPAGKEVALDQNCYDDAPR